MKKLLLCLLMVVLLFTGCGKKEVPSNPTDGDRVENKNEDVVKDQLVEGLKFTKTALVYQNGETILTTEITNTNSLEYNLGLFHAIVKDKEGNVMAMLASYAGDTIPSGETRKVNTISDKDLSNAYSIEYSITK